MLKEHCHQSRFEEFPDRGSQLRMSGVVDRHCRSEFKDVSVTSKEIYLGKQGVHIKGECSHLQNERQFEVLGPFSKGAVVRVGVGRYVGDTAR